MVTIKRIAITKVNTIVKYVLFAKIVLSCEFTFLLGWLTGPIIRIKMAQNAYSTKEINSGMVKYFTDKITYIPKKEIVTYDYVAESKNLPYERIEVLNKIYKKQKNMQATSK